MLDIKSSAYYFGTNEYVVRQLIDRGLLTHIKKRGIPLSDLFRVKRYSVLKAEYLKVKFDQDKYNTTLEGLCDPQVSKSLPSFLQSGEINDPLKRLLEPVEKLTLKYKN